MDNEYFDPRLENIADPRNKITDRDYETVRDLRRQLKRGECTGDILNKQGQPIDFEAVLTDCILEIERLRAICQLVHVTQRAAYAQRCYQQSRKHLRGPSNNLED